jgi:hypothetical protein
MRKITAKRSRRIPETIKVNKSKSGRVSITAGGKAAPQAAEFDPDRWPPDARHPVFARNKRSTWTWAPMPHFPFRDMAAEEAGDAAAEAVADEIAKWADGIGRDHPGR